MKKIIILLSLVLTLFVDAQNTFYTPDDEYYSNGTNILEYTDSSFIVANAYYDINVETDINGLQLIAFNQNMELIWERRYNINLEGFFISGFGTLIRTNDNGFAFAAFKRVSDYWYSNVYLMKFDSLGILEWDKHYGLAQTVNRGLGLLENSLGDFLITGLASVGNNLSNIYVVNIDNETQD
ncbi:MAG: hypothetical protein ACPG5B_08630, partial [Chitinophagales bacterium]